MNHHAFTFSGADLRALGSGALWWPDQALLCVSDLHLGKSERVARRSGQSLPPYETRDTLTRLAADLERTGARAVICLGDSFDDAGAAASLPGEDRAAIAALQAGRRWIWIAGNHDPAPVDFGGEQRGDVVLGPLIFRHIATADGTGEVSGHYHPKADVQARGRRISRPAFLLDINRLILPAYGTYTGGLHSHSDALRGLMAPSAIAILTGPVPTCVPMPR
ncbi:ligase-associated DNA damage response endonuclease PdeM [uncultured Roseobacter sp.]|uniref:ligase-associated DNA damage response endonuclease PdeM n=1 Tax=uncultured Roseobacter sp. TaxID=114847 RepID=UPI002623393E|nr:ligase-associated DNA damage response endonuclease PdeM [uncultured Roseobacter sp.]